MHDLQGLEPSVAAVPLCGDTMARGRGVGGVGREAAVRGHPQAAADGLWEREKWAALESRSTGGCEAGSPGTAVVRLDSPISSGAWSLSRVTLDPGGSAWGLLSISRSSASMAAVPDQPQTRISGAALPTRPTCVGACVCACVCVWGRAGRHTPRRRLAAFCGTPPLAAGTGLLASVAWPGWRRPARVAREVHGSRPPATPPAWCSTERTRHSLQGCRRWQRSPDRKGRGRAPQHARSR